MAVLNRRKREALPDERVGLWMILSAKSPEYWFSAVVALRRNAVVRKNELTI